MKCALISSFITPDRFNDTLNFTLVKKKILSRSCIVKLVYLKEIIFLGKC